MATKANKKQAKPAKKPAAKTAAAKKPAAKASARPPAKTAAAAKPAAKTTAAAKAKPDPKLAAKAGPAVKAAAKQPALQPTAKANAKVPVKAGAKAGKPGEETPGDADSPLLDMSDVGVRKMIAKAKTRGYVTYDELNKVLPSDKVSSEQIEDTMSMLNEMGINVIESEEQEEGADENLPATQEGGKEVATKTGTAAEQYDRTDDPVRMYLREMGSVELLSREGEIAIAKRIEAGRELMIGALCESPLTFEALTVWRDELNEGKVLLRDIIDLEAMYAVGPEGQAAAAAQAAASAA
ncbi:MAG TPA: RNA polymerase sigma factor region1.1 domain-containing protein, partial [Rhizomicrobium sp.]